MAADHLRSLHHAAVDALSAGEPGAALFGFLRHVVETAGPKQDLTQALADAGGSASEQTVEAAAELRAAVDALVARAQQASAVRTDVDALAVQATVVGAVAAVRHSSRPEVGAMILDCLRP